MKLIAFFSSVFLIAMTTYSSSITTRIDDDFTWKDPEKALREDPDFAVQGEYANDQFGAQIIARGAGRFDVSLLEGGLPGAGWEPGKSRFLLTGERKDDKIVFVDSLGTVSARWENGFLLMTPAGGEQHQLSRIERRSPTLGATPPADALVLFDGSSTEQWENAKIENGYLQATGATTKQRFGDYKLHLEFRTPYKPRARGQQRGNSGIYHSGRWETQILDSFGLDPKDNECGGIYSIAQPRLNMCLPPLVWQTYDVEFTTAEFDGSGKRTAWPRMTVRLNGELIHEHQELPKDFTTSAPLSSPLDGPLGPVYLQEHGNPVEFRNIWIVPSLRP